MVEIKAPGKRPPYPLGFGEFKLHIFLGGSIEQGLAAPWQQYIVSQLAEHDDIVIFNPRRDEWDSSWEQSIDNPQFNEQVTWELDALDESDIVAFFFDPNTRSPITLLELGLMAESGAEVLVCCPEGFWRKGNVDIVCKRFNIKQVDSLEALVTQLKKVITSGDYCYR